MLEAGHWYLLAFASGMSLSAGTAVDIPLWNPGCSLAHSMSETSEFCWELLLPPQSRTGSFSVLPDLGALSLQGPTKDIRVTFNGMWKSSLLRRAVSLLQSRAWHSFLRWLWRAVIGSCLSSPHLLRCFLSPLYAQVESQKALLYFSLPHFVWFLHAEQWLGELIFKNWGPRPFCWNTALQ